MGIARPCLLKHILSKCSNSPKILVDKGPWYKPAPNRLNVEWEHITFGLHNPVEQWFGIFKQPIKHFYKNWPCHSTVESTQRWIDSFTAMYHLMRC
ncbi:MAG: hypothetical protein V5A64_05875 [Candidatus Thermoplasmatota archaeon]